MGFGIAIDGPAGVGKTTVAKKVAEKLGFVYVDTGAMYRAVGLYCLENGIGTKDRESLKDVMNKIDISIVQEKSMQMVYLNDRNVTGDIRTAAVSKAASDVGTIPEVREKLVAMQKRMAEEADVVMEGRDTCNSVLPGAEVKIYLTASIDERTRRRCRDLDERNILYWYNEVKRNLEERDWQDMHREVSPLRKAPDAVEINSTDMNASEVVQIIVNLAKRGIIKK